MIGASRRGRFFRSTEDERENETVSEEGIALVLIKKQLHRFSSLAVELVGLAGCRGWKEHIQ